METRLRPTLRRIVLASFPTLRRRAIAIRWGTGDFLFEYGVSGRESFIRVHELFREAPRRVLEGGMVHELCHIEADLKLGSFSRELGWASYARSRWHRTREERKVELRAVELGYGTHLLAMIGFVRRLGHTFTREDGLSYAEIRRLVAGRRG